VTPVGPRFPFSLPPSVRILDSSDGIPHLDVATHAGSAQVFFHGAHLVRWAPAHVSAPVLWLSSRSAYRRDKGIRGGVPICFPWFGPHASDRTAPAHGFARLVDWTLAEAAESADGTVMLSFVLETKEGETPLWPHRARTVYRLAIGATLGMTLEVENPGAGPFTFEEALHTYVSVHDVENISIAGLEATDYLDKVQGFARRHQGDEPIRFAGETDRVYLETEATCRISDPGWSRTIVVSKSGSRSTVVWNPGVDKAATFADIGPDEWRQMVCVETANIGAAAVRLAPGETHTMRAEVSVE
jgi:glucose-6-phosphate 1-epimerase